MSPIDENVAAFRALHRGERVLVLPNAWDAATTALVRTAGAPAIAIASAALSWAWGYPDAGVIPREALLFSTRAIVRAANGLHVTVDIEDGYSADPAAVAALCAELRRLGAVGVNVEDGSAPPEALAAKIAAIKTALAGNGADIFVNARTDVYLRGAQGEAAAREAIARLERYARAGADGIFVPAIELDAIERVTQAVPLPLNILLEPEQPPLAELYRIGVRRLSAGPALAKLALGAVRSAAAALLHDDRRDERLFAGGGVTYGEMNELMAALDR